MKKRKPLMVIGLAGRNVTFSGNYTINWGKLGGQYNKQSKAFETRKKALAFKNKLIKKFKPTNKIRYIYISG